MPSQHEQLDAEAPQSHALSTKAKQQQGPMGLAGVCRAVLRACRSLAGGKKCFPTFPGGQD